MKPQKDLRLLVKALFKITLTPTQIKLIKAILFKKKAKRIIITAMTRYGKSLAVAIASVLYLITNSNKKVIIVSERQEQARIIMDYVINLLLSHPLSLSLLDVEEPRKERLKRELRKARIKLKNDSEVRIISAHGKGQQLLGHGGDLIIVDESGLIGDKAYKLYILRMLGDDPDNAKLVEIGNPVELNHFYESWNDPNYIKFHIDWKLALKEKRTTIGFINEQKKRLSDIEFKVMYDAEFPDSTEDGLIKFSLIEEALTRKIELQGQIQIVMGVDVARYGKDKTVMTIMKTDGRRWVMEKVKSYSGIDTMEAVSYIRQLEEEYNFDRIIIDDIGVGGGVVDRLKETEFSRKVIPFIASKSPRDKKRFHNLKTEVGWNLRTLFERGAIQIQNISDLVIQLRREKYKIDSGKKIKLIDPKDKSPDFFDSLLIACYEIGRIYVTRRGL